MVVVVVVISAVAITVFLETAASIVRSGFVNDPVGSVTDGHKHGVRPSVWMDKSTLISKIRELVRATQSPS